MSQAGPRPPDSPTSFPTEERKMRTHHASTTNRPASSTNASPVTGAPLSERGSDCAAWSTPRKRSIAELADDSDALEDWHRNLARLRAQEEH